MAVMGLMAPAFYHFYPNVTTLRSGIWYRNSVSVTFVPDPTQPVEMFGNVFKAIL